MPCVWYKVLFNSTLVSFVPFPIPLNNVSVTLMPPVNVSLNLEKESLTFEINP